MAMCSLAIFSVSNTMAGTGKEGDIVEWMNKILRKLEIPWKNKFINNNNGYLLS